MKSLIVYESIHHGNTQKIAKAMAACLGADLIKAKDVDMNALSGYDLIGFGSGIYFGAFHKNMLHVLDNLPALSKKKAFVFSTSGMGKVDLNNAVEQRLKEKGMDVVGSFASKGYDTVGPFKLIGGIAKGKPDEGDIQRAKAFAEKL